MDFFNVSPNFSNISFCGCEYPKRDLEQVHDDRFLEHALIVLLKKKNLNICVMSIIRIGMWGIFWGILSGMIMGFCVFFFFKFI
jgi:hypothetical protein